jgi:hypothetical protein
MQIKSPVDCIILTITWAYTNQIPVVDCIILTITGAYTNQIPVVDCIILTITGAYTNKKTYPLYNKETL